jgi:hypothetical protein
MNDDTPKLDYAGPQPKAPESKTLSEKLVLCAIIAIALAMVLPIVGIIVFAKMCGPIP